jgi:hypothetical protein
MRRDFISIVGAGRSFKKFHFPALKKIQYLGKINIFDPKFLKNSNEDKQLVKFNNYKTFRNKSKKTLRIVLSPNTLHFKHVIDGLNDRCDILVEKPITTNYLKAKEIFNISKKKKLNVTLVNQQIYSKEFLELKKKINTQNSEINFSLEKKNQIPRRNTFSNYKLSGGGILMDYAPHILSILNELEKIEKFQILKVEKKFLKNKKYIDYKSCFTLKINNFLIVNCNLNYTNNIKDKFEICLKSSSTGKKHSIDYLKLKKKIKTNILASEMIYYHVFDLFKKGFSLKNFYKEKNNVIFQKIINKLYEN